MKNNICAELEIYFNLRNAIKKNLQNNFSEKHNIIHLFELYEELAKKNKIVNQINLTKLKEVIISINENSINILSEIFLLIQNDYFKLPLKFFYGIGNAKEKQLKELNINNLNDIIFTFPKFYYFVKQVKKIKELELNETATIFGTIKTLRIIRRRFKKRQIAELIIEDDSGYIKALLFNVQIYIKKILRVNEKIYITGKVKLYQEKTIIPVFYFLTNEENKNRFIKYNLENISDRFFNKLVEQAINYLAKFYIELLPNDLLKNRNYPDFVNSIKKIHFPQNFNDKIQGLSRLIYEEFLFFQIAMQYKKYKEKYIFKNFLYNEKANEKINNFINNLPFKLTNAQIKVIEEIKNDMFSKFKMNRLIQGDVGSGKTIVAAVAIFYAILSNYQVAVMAPTDILAHQHYSTFKKLFANFNFNISLLVHKINKKEKNLIYENLRNGQINLIIGTHALFQKNVYFKNIKLVVIDEQHRFGVQQREELIKKGFDVDVLMLTATPIPRTLTLTIYGDTDVSIIDELPPHKKMIKTFVRKEKDRINIFNFIKEKIKNENEQVFIICPLISKSNKSNFKDVENYFKEISSNYFKEFNCAFLHSKIKNKDEIIEQFRKNEINILVSTTVIEVGIDIPSANIIIIEDANKFGLSQLHQLRGRVGRGNKESYCILIINDNISKLAETRIKTLEKYNDGFKISEIDLFLRGTGELTGIKQSGLSEFQFGNLLKNKKELLYAFYDAKKIIETDSFKSKMLIKKSIKKFGNKIDKIFV